MAATPDVSELDDIVQLFLVTTIAMAENRPKSTSEKSFKESQKTVFSFPDSAHLTHALAEFVLHAQTEAIHKKGKFTIAISGGSLAKQLGGLVGQSNARWDKWYAHLQKIF